MNIEYKDLNMQIGIENNIPRRLLAERYDGVCCGEDYHSCLEEVIVCEAFGLELAGENM